MLRGHEHHSVGSRRTQNRSLGGAQLAIDVDPSKRSHCGRGLHATTQPEWMEQGFALSRRDKERKHQELVKSERCLLVVVASETGGRWSEEAMKFVESLAAARSRGCLPVMQRSVFLAWRRRWKRLLAVSCCRTFASSLTSSSEALEGVDGTTTDLICSSGLTDQCAHVSLCTGWRERCFQMELLSVLFFPKKSVYVRVHTVCMCTHEVCGVCVHTVCVCVHTVCVWHTGGEGGCTRGCVCVCTRGVCAHTGCVCAPRRVCVRMHGVCVHTVSVCAHGVCEDTVCVHTVCVHAVCVYVHTSVCLHGVCMYTRECSTHGSVAHGSVTHTGAGVWHTRG